MSVRTIVKSIQDIMRQDVGVDGDAQRISQLCWMFFLKIIDDQDQELELLDADYRSPIPEALRWRAWAADPEGITGDELLDFANGRLFPGLKGLSIAGAGQGRRRVVRDVFEDAYNYMKSGQLMRQVINKINGVDFNDLAARQHFGDVYEQVLNDLQSAGNAGEYYTPRAVTGFMVERTDPKPGEVLLDPACGTGGFLTGAIGHMRQRYVKKVEDEQQMQAGLRAVEKKPLPHMLCVTNMLLHGVQEPGFVRHDNTLARPYVSYTSADRVDVVLTNPPFGGREEDGIESNFPKHFQTRETADLFLAQSTCVAHGSEHTQRRGGTAGRGAGEADGETKTEAVTRALRDRLARVRRERSRRGLADELDAIARHCAALPVRDARTADEILGYADDGVPC